MMVLSAGRARPRRNAIMPARASIQTSVPGFIGVTSATLPIATRSSRPGRYLYQRSSTSMQSAWQSFQATPTPVKPSWVVVHMGIDDCDCLGQIFWQRMMIGDNDIQPLRLGVGYLLGVAGAGINGDEQLAAFIQPARNGGFIEAVAMQQPMRHKGAHIGAA